MVTGPPQQQRPQPPPRDHGLGRGQRSVHLLGRDVEPEPAQPRDQRARVRGLAIAATARGALLPTQVSYALFRLYSFDPQKGAGRKSLSLSGRKCIRVGDDRGLRRRKKRLSEQRIVGIPPPPL